MKRAQAALEFISTYGWAILIVLVMIGALSFFGVTNPSKYLPEKCIASTGFGCEDFIIQAHSSQVRPEVEVVLSNNLGKAIKLVDVAISHDGIFSTAPRVDDLPMGGGNIGHIANTFETIDVGDEFFVSANPGGGSALVNLVEGESAKILVEINYTEVGGRYTHKAVVDISGEVKE